jgi:photosystem II stability/assembly factor-like uncharacterized protein
MQKPAHPTRESAPRLTSSANGNSGSPWRHIAAIFAAAVGIGTLAGCATQTTSPLNLANAGLPDPCLSLNALSNDAAATKLDIPQAMFVKMKEIAKTDNAGICTMPQAEREKTMLAYRNLYKNPDRKTFRAPAKEFIREWDMDSEGKLPTSTQMLAAEAKRKALSTSTLAQQKAAGISPASWSFIGPGNVGGRIRAILIDPRDERRFLIGAASGGIWLSTDAGQSYRAVADFSGNLAIGSMAFDPNNPNIVYAGTGESFTGLAGIGMFKSVDGGNSWSFMPSTTTDANANPFGNEWGSVNRIAIAPNNSNLILAATSRGTALNQGAIMRSTDGGNSWIRIQLTPGTVSTVNPPAIYDIKFDPFNANNLLAGTQNGQMYYSRDAGVSWTATEPLATTLTGRSTSARAEIAWAKTVPNLVYISFDNNKGEVWKSENAGQNWALLSNPKHLNDQGDYDNTIWVSPTDPNHIVTGGLDLYQSIDGGVNFNKISTWQAGGPGAPQPHADHHVIVSGPNYSEGNRVVYIGNDGGIYRSTDIRSAGPTGTSTWQNLNNGLGVTQFYGGAGKRSAGGKIIGGTQDNGTLILGTGTNWERFAGGDGGFVAVDPVDDNTLYGEYVYASIHRTLGLSTRTYICGGITEALKNVGTSIYCGADATEEANFISPFILDPNNRDRMLVGAKSLWLSKNVRDTTPAWAAIKPPVATTATTRHFINAVAVHEGDSNIIWVAYNSTGQVWKTTDGLAATPNWSLVNNGLPSGTVNRVTIDKDNPNRVWVAFSGFAPNRLWQTLDGGASWTSITANLPAVTLHDIKRHPTQPNWLYVGAANGVYTSENGGQSWNTSNDGPSSVRVRELFWYDPSTLIAATYGRGMFKATVAGGGPADYSDLWWAGAAENGWGMSINQHGQIQFNAFYVYDSAGTPGWYVMPGGSWNADFTTYTGALYQPTSAPLNNYDTSRFAPGASVGNASLSFTSASTATLLYNIRGATGQKSITRQIFGPADNTPGLKVGDIWWGGTSQNGWGVSITQQNRTLFAAWYTYAPDGTTSWYVMPGGAWAGNSYTGKIYSTRGPNWFATPYNVSQFNAQEVGSVTFAFQDANNATMNYSFTAGPYAGTTQSKPISRQPF